MRRMPVAFFVTSVALCLGACGGGSEPAEDSAVRDVKDPTVELTPIQQANYERLNRQEVMSSYTALVRGMEAGQPAPPEDEMDLEWLDRDDNGKISVAELALWKFPAEPGSEATLSQEQVTEAASQFFANDTDGDQLLSAEEFAAATGRPAPPPEDGDAAETG